ncbi:PREDICTED: uncharacterized protein LOC105145485 isoform X2 [Acromyrmex echinatior]|uniref:uncharacterized protein LOC105145485 isoform X2 n=1 Tax=Acromyrmex echinatior TaxID=103372 RepID=UPI000580EF3B|nr:PREDICTED: uncharacterized protein LOC105145485 isoform X2 [Acromyrmex echinatior]
MDIQTFVFFDLETTGLIQENVMPRITEIALVAVSTESIRNGNKNCLPRVLHKLVLPVNPQKVIPVQVQHMTTHNGNKFDYPIFLEELKRINKILSDEILCIDTWKMFDDFFKKRNLQSTVFQDLLNDEFNDSLSTLDMDVVTKESKIIAMTSTAQTMLLCDDKYIKAVNTKVDSCNNDVDIQSSKNPIQVANEKTPKAQKTKSENVFMQRPVKKNNLKKRLNFEEKIEFERPSSLKLIAIHEHIVGKHFEEHHSAEADCLAMIRCISNIVDFFLDWSNNHAIPLTYCKKKI